MPQLSLYMNDKTMDTLRQCAALEGVSLSSYAASLIRKAANGSAWPDGYWENVYGCLSDDEAECFKHNDATLDPSLDDSCDWFA